MIKPRKRTIGGILVLLMLFASPLSVNYSFAESQESQEKPKEEEQQTEKAEDKKVSTVPEYKKKIVADLAEKIKSSKTVLIASSKGLPGGQFHSIKKKY